MIERPSVFMDKGDIAKYHNISIRAVDQKLKAGEISYIKVADKYRVTPEDYLMSCEIFPETRGHFKDACIDLYLWALGNNPQVEYTKKGFNEKIEECVNKYISMVSNRKMDKSLDELIEKKF